MIKDYNLGKNREPVFVFGALRSGTTVFRLMLNAHPELSNPGEMDFLFDHLSPDPLHSTNWRYDLVALQADRIFQAHDLTIPKGKTGLDLFSDFLDQLHAQHPGTLVLTVHRHADRLIRLFPTAAIVHLIRDPRDVARSSIGMGWASSLYYGVNHWIQTEQSWDCAIRGHEGTKILQLKYEDLFYSTEESLRRVCDTFGVSFTDKMLQYHESTSYAPPDPSLVEQWRHRCKPEEIELLEGKAGKLMRARGYELLGEGRVPGPFEKLRLKLGQKIFLWKFGIGRFGARLFLGEKITRWLGFSNKHSELLRQMTAVQKTYLK